MFEPLMTKKDVAEYLQVSEKTIERYVADGLIKPVKNLSIIRFNPADISRLIGIGIEPYPPLLRKQQEQRISDLEQENQRLKEYISKTVQVMAEGVSYINK